MADFKIAKIITAQAEGGYANNLADTGGETMYGISRKFNPNWTGWKLVDSIKKEVGTSPSAINKKADRDPVLHALVDSFYKTNYWDVNRLDAVTSQSVANELFDTGVNMGVRVAAEFLQRALNITNNNGKLFEDLIVDGAIGQRTLSALSISDAKLIYKILNVLQGAKYVAICEANKSQEIFVKSWFSRVDILK